MRTEKDLLMMYMECINLMNKYGFKVNPINIKLNNRIKKTLGRYTHSKQLIEINKTYFEQAKEEAIKNTIIHEICHQLTPYHGHDTVWKSLAYKVSNKTGYKITTRATKDKLEGVIFKEEIFKYKAVCECCGLESKYKRASNVIKHPEFYRCKCGGKLKIEKL